jgi:hypothetical protein
MRRRRSFRLAVASFALALAATSGGAVTAQEPTASTSAAVPSDHGHANKGPRGHARMDKATDKKSSGRTVPRPASPFAKAASHAPRGPGPAIVAPLPVQATLLPPKEPISQPGFDGLSHSSGPDTLWQPPDPYVAVGPDHVMQSTNSSFRFTDRSGAVAAPPETISGFIDAFGFGGFVDPQWFDPHVIYDSVHARWLMTVNGVDCTPSLPDETFGTGYLFFATSDTNDPTGFWTGAYFYAQDFLMDYSAPGTSSDKFAWSTNYFAMGAGCSGNAYGGADVTAIDWADWLGADSDFLYKQFPFSTNYATPRIAIQTPATTGRLHIVAEFTNDAWLTSHVRYISVTGSVKALTAIKDIDVDLTAAGVIAPFLLPPPPNQPGPDTIANAVDERPTDAVWQNNRLSFVSTYQCTPTGDSTTRDCVRISQLSTNGVSSVVHPSLRQDFLIAENGRDNYMGGVGVAGNGTLHAVWTRSSATAGEFPSSNASYQLPTDAINTISPREVLQAGTGAYTGERWGDYVGVAQDPLVPSAVWQANQYSGGATEWKTWVSKLQTPGTTYVPITPLRVLDTRSGVGGLAGKFTNGQARTWQVGGIGGIPANAVAVTGNVTVTQQTASGFVAVTPTATNTPPSSSINFPVGDNRANNLTVALSSTGTLSATYKAATAGKQTHLIFDVTGYFLADETGATFSTITPVRVLDSRHDIGLTGAFANKVPRPLQITGGAIPATAIAITGNLTVTQQSAAGFLAVTTTPTATPATSTLNFPVGDNRANGVYAPLTAGGALSIVYVSGTAGAHTHVILDITGYFEQGLGGLHFFPLNPARIMDTRNSGSGSHLVGVFHAGTNRTLGVVGHWGVPAGAKAVSGNLTVTGQTGSGFVAATKTPTNTPATSTLNFPLGDTRANGLVTPLGGLGETVTYLVYVGAAGKTTHLILDLSGYFE